MIKKKSAYLFLLICLMSFTGFSQHINDLKINEILIKNDTNYADEYARHVPWVEIFNTAYNSVNIAECYLTNDTTGLYDGSGIKHWYRIPKGDPLTLIPQRSFLIFYMDDAPLYGTFHVNFDPGKEGAPNYVALINSNGKKLIDIFEFPDSLRCAQHSYGCREDGVKENIGFLEYFTPGSTNKVFEGLTKAERLQQRDPHGLGLSIISMVVVFIALAIIFLMLKLFARLNRSKKPKAKSEQPIAAVPFTSTKDEDITGEELAAVAAALQLHFADKHDVESEIITLEAQAMPYSPWAQKHISFKKVTRK
ncbi:MAG: OadG family protein [Bacteroidales bacterium]|nr:OadG family protein [Bacteroidales bacterium]